MLGFPSDNLDNLLSNKKIGSYARNAYTRVGAIYTKDIRLSRLSRLSKPFIFIHLSSTTFLLEVVGRLSVDDTLFPPTDGYR